MNGVVCKGCRYNVVPWDKPDSLCPSCRDIEKQKRARGKLCKSCGSAPPFMNHGDLCLTCQMDKSVDGTLKKRRWFSWF